MLETQPMAYTLIIQNIISALVLHSGSSSKSHKVWNKVCVSKRQNPEEENDSQRNEALNRRWMELKRHPDIFDHCVFLCFSMLPQFHLFKFPEITEPLDCLPSNGGTWEDQYHLCVQYRGRSLVSLPQKLKSGGNYQPSCKSANNSHLFCIITEKFTGGKAWHSLICFP